MRWPLHPTPAPAEPLHCWLDRIAGRYALTTGDLTGDLVGRELEDDALDFDPPLRLVSKIAEKTGISVEAIRRMTFAGIAPGVFKGNPLPTDTFRKYVGSAAFLLPLGTVPFRDHPYWIPWYKAHRFNNPCNCPRCSGSSIFWWTLLLSCCPIYKVPLRSSWSRQCACSGHLAFDPPELPVPPELPGSLVRLDGFTISAFTAGSVKFAGSTLSLQAWARMLRTIVEELSVPYNSMGAEKSCIKNIWRLVGKRPSNRLGQPFEALNSAQQFKFLHALSIAVELIGRGEITLCPKSLSSLETFGRQ